MIYLDYNATTPIDPDVLSTMTACFHDYFANSASVSHHEGIKAYHHLEKCRATVAQMIDADPNHIIFNSGASEANNTVIRAVVDYYKPQGTVHIITSSIEHKCLINICEHLKQREDVEVTYLPVDKSGKVCIQALKTALQPNTRLISIMAANNETGTLQPLQEISQIAHDHHILFHTDAAQWIGKLPFSVKDIKPNFVSISAHKFYGPKGVGVLYCNQQDIILNSPLVHGGGQESGMRSGTANLPGIAGMAKAAELFIALHEDNIAQQRQLKTYLLKKLRQFFPHAIVNGCEKQSLPNTINFSLPAVKSSTLLKKLKMKVALSSASACLSSEQKPSHVLSAMGLDDEISQSAIRLSFGNRTTLEDLDTALDLIYTTYERLKEH